MTASTSTESNPEPIEGAPSVQAMSFTDMANAHVASETARLQEAARLRERNS